MNRHSLKSLLISLCVVASVAIASSVTLPFTFTANTPARASEVNGNFAAVKTAVDDNNTRITSLETAPVYAAATLYAGWTNLPQPSGSAPYNAAEYLKEKSGVVHLRGAVKRSTSATPGNIFSLPAGFRPPGNSYFSVACGGPSTCYVVINNNGNVDFVGGDPSGLLSLEGITFVAQ